jgi:uncharacterized membrane protein YdjX (TVP38/TMEM64 family)
MKATPKQQRRIAMLIIFCVFAVTAFLVAETFRLLLPGLWTAFRSGDENALSRYLNSEGTLRSFFVLWFLSFVQVVAIVIPAMPVQLAAGIAYGPWKGFFSSFSASALANMLVFLLARRMLPVIDMLTADSPRARKMLSSVRASRDPWFYTILAFMTPGLPNGIIPYAAASAGMKPRSFLGAIFLALPLPTLLTCAAGSFILSGDWIVSVWIGVGLYSCVGILFFRRARVLEWAHNAWARRPQHHSGQ